MPSIYLWEPSVATGLGKFFSDFVDFFTNAVLIRANLPQKKNCQPEIKFQNDRVVEIERY